MNWLEKISQVPPRFLYHATYRVNVNSIFQQGLIPRYICVWKECENGVYLANDPYEAASYPEIADENEDIPDEWLENIAVLQIDTMYLDIALLERDPHRIWEKTENPTCWIYRGSIPSEALTLLK